MRASIRLLIVAIALAGCSGGASDAQKEEVETLKKRVGKLENRVRLIESRSSAKGGKAGKAPARGKAPAKAGGGAAAKAGGSKAKTAKTKGPGGAGAGAQAAGPTVQVEASGDAKAVMLAGGGKRFKLPARVPAGHYVVLAAFGDETLARKGEIDVAADADKLTVNCTESAGTCTAK